MLVSKALHLIFIVFWIGGLIFLTSIARGAEKLNLSKKDISPILERMLNMFILPGIVFVLVTGVYQLVAGGIGVYMKQPAFHLKLTLVPVLIVMTLLVVFETKKWKDLEGKSKFGLYHGIIAASFVAIVFTMYVFR